MSDISLKARKVILNMLRARKYEVNEDEYNNCDEMYLTYKIGNPMEKIYIFFPQVTSKVGVFTIRQYIKEMQEKAVGHSIIIVKDEVTAFAKVVFTEAKPLIIEHFRENELIIDKVSHVLVPKHELLDETEKKELLKIYKIKEVNLPKIISSDPICRYFGGKKGQVFKITRQSETSGETIYYRVVV